MLARLVRGPWLVIGLYIVLSVITLVVWDARGVYGFTGDEPHYLVIADSLVQDRSVEVTGAYARELAEPRFYELGLADPGSELAPPAAHVVETPMGLVSWHGIGIPLIIALPLAMFGMWGVKMVLLASGLIVIGSAWAVATWVGLPGGRRSAAVTSLAVAYPVLLASTQVYPDLWAGALLLASLSWLAVPRMRTPGVTVAVSVGVGALPWLGMKFAPAAAVVGVGIVAAVWGRGRSWIPALVPAALLGVALAVVNVLVFGSVTGAPVAGTLSWGREFLMLVPGLLLDQNQGAMFYNPVLWCGLLGIGLLWRAHRGVAVVWSMTFLAVWLPGAAHPGLYGLGSFNGRYSWALATLLIIPAVLALQWLARTWRPAFWIVVISGLLFQAYVFVISVFVGGTGPGTPPGLNLYTQPAETWLESYSALWFPIQQGLPAFYDVSWAAKFGPNLAWVLVAVVVVLVGFLIPVAVSVTGRRVPVVVVVALGMLLVMAGISGLLTQPGPREAVTVAPSVSRAGVDQVGFPVTGPWQAMRQGTYEWFVDYRAEGRGTVGKWEVIRSGDGAAIAAGEITGTGGEASRAGIALRYLSLQPQDFALRIGWYGTETMTTSTIGVRRVG